MRLLSCSCLRDERDYSPRPCSVDDIYNMTETYATLYIPQTEPKEVILVPDRVRVEITPYNS